LPVTLAQASVAPAWSGPLPPASPEPADVAQPVNAESAWRGPLPAAADEPTSAPPEPGGLLQAEFVPPSPVAPEQPAPMPAASVAQTAATPASSSARATADAAVRLGADYYVGNPTQVAAAEPPAARPDFLRGIEVEVGARYFWSTGTMLKALKNASGSAGVSRLTYSGLDANSGEAFGRVELRSGLFAKAVLGAGDSDHGNLKDEDYPPFLSPYSATNSQLRNGSLQYATADVGWDLLAFADWQARADHTLGVQKAHFGPFVGYSYFHEEADAYGCTQTASNTSVCTPAISGSVLVITQKDDWDALRVGLAGDVTLLDRLTIGAEGAYLPWGSFNGSDTHWLRLGTGKVGDFSEATPETGDVKGFQAEVTLTFRVTDSFRLNAGGRYWYFRSHATEHFEQSAIPAGGFSPQQVDRRDNRYGAFVGGSWTF